MIYFDNAATSGRKPKAVETAVTSAVKLCANPGRSGHKLSLSCAATVQNARYALNALFDGYGFDRVVFTKNCTEALNIALFGVLKKGDHVVASCMEHNSVLRVLEKLKNEKVITYDVCPLDKTGKISPSRIKSLLKKQTRLVAVSCASNVNGSIPDIAKIKQALPTHILLLCDGAQAGGHFPVSMQKLGIDLLALAGHKGLLGIQGSGALLFSERVDPVPILYGGTGSMSISLEMPNFYPDALEAGTLSFPAVSALLEGVRFVEKRIEKIGAHTRMLTEYFLENLQAINGYKAYSIANPCGIVAFGLKNVQSEYLASVLSARYDIATRGGLHCAPLMHEALSTLNDGLLRVSFSLFNQTHEIDELLLALQEIAMEN